MNDKKQSIIEQFVYICNFLGDAVDMIQAGGGNASAKTNNEMYIKASGYLMSEVTPTVGFTRVKRDAILNLVKQLHVGTMDKNNEVLINESIAAANLDALRPSIETFLHALLPQKFVLHVHALTSLIYASSKTFVMDLEQQWVENYPLKHILLIPYKKPGVELALALYEGLERYNVLHDTAPAAIVLQNHGLIVASDDYEELYDQIVQIQRSIQNHIGLLSTIDEKYRLQQHLKYLLLEANGGAPICIRVSEDVDLQGDVIKGMCFPDALVYCGYEPLTLDADVDASEQMDAIKRYQTTYGELPKIILYQGKLFFIGESIKKCLEVQDVLKIQVLVQNQLGEDLVHLNYEDAQAILNWEAEIYRKNL